MRQLRPLQAIRGAADLTSCYTMAKLGPAQFYDNFIEELIIEHTFYGVPQESGAPGPTS